MFVIEPKSTVKYLAVVEGVISSAFLVCLIVLRIHVSVTGVVPDWIIELNTRHWSRSFVTTADNTNGFLIISLLIYFILLIFKLVLSVLLWRSVPKDYFSRNSRRLLHWIWAMIVINLIGICLLALLNYSGAFEVTLAKIFSILTCFLDIFCIASVLWLRRVIQLHVGLGAAGAGNSSGAYIMHDARIGNESNRNQNHNLRPCTIF